MVEYVSAEEAVKVIKSGNRVFIHSAAAAPEMLVNALTARKYDLENVEIVHLHTEGEAPYASPGMQKSFHVNALFVGSNIREAVQGGMQIIFQIFLVKFRRFSGRGFCRLMSRLCRFLFLMRMAIVR